MKFKLNDKVTIVKRNSGNRTGASSEFHKPNGDVGKKGYVEKIFSGSGRFLVTDINATDDGSDYLGIFDADELELTNKTKEVNKKYKLIQSYPGSPEVGTIYTPDGLGNYNYNSGDYTTALPRELLGDVNFFEEIEQDIFKKDDYVYVKDTGSHYSTHPDRRVIDGIGFQNCASTNKGVYRVLSYKEKFNNCDHVLVLTDGVHSFWYGFDDRDKRSRFRLATEAEILSYLINKTTLKVGDKVTTDKAVIDNYDDEYSADCVSNRKIHSFMIHNDELYLILQGDESLPQAFKVSDFTKVEESKKVMIGEYELVNNNNGTISLGCQTYTLDDVKAVRRTMEIGQLKEVTLRGTVITGKILSLLEAAINRLDTTVRVGLKFRHHSSGNEYTISNIRGKEIDLVWKNGGSLNGGYTVERTEQNIKAGTWIVIG